jgi:hypothetical protein
VKLDSSLARFDSTTWKFDSGTLVPTSFIATFTADEAALSQGGKWINGTVTNFWKAPKTVGGVACASSPNDTEDDSIAQPTGVNFGSSYHMAVTIRRAANYVPTDGQEVELNHFNIAPGNQGTCQGIEGTFQFFSDANSNNFQCVIWVGPPHQFDTTTLGGLTVSGGGQIKDGDVLATRRNGNTFTYYHNDVQIVSFVNSTFPNTVPTIGFFQRPTGTVAESYGIAKVEITSLSNIVLVPSQAFTAGTRQATLTNIDPALSQFKLVLNRSAWPAGQIGNVDVECAVDGVTFKHVGGLSLAGGSPTFKGRSVTSSQLVCGIPGVGTAGRAIRTNFTNSSPLTTAISGYGH